MRVRLKLRHVKKRLAGDLTTDSRSRNIDLTTQGWVKSEQQKVSQRKRRTVGKWKLSPHIAHRRDCLFMAGVSTMPA